MSDQIKQVRAFKLRSFKSTSVARFMYPILSKLNFHIVALPLPTSMPVWLKCEVDASYIKLQGIPRPENKGKTITIRIFNVGDYIIREFEIEIEEGEEISYQYASSDVVVSQ